MITFEYFIATYISGYENEMKQWNEKKEELPLLGPKFDMSDKKETQQLLIDLENQMDENGEQISVPLFRVSGTSLDIEKMLEKLNNNDKTLGGETSYQPKSRPLSTQWKTRIG